MYLHTIDGYYDISSKFDFHVARLKIEVNGYF